MSDTKQLEALRDAALNDGSPLLNKNHLDRAIAALRAEQPAVNCPWHGTSAGDECWRCVEQPADAARKYDGLARRKKPARQHCTCAFDDVPGEYPCAVHGDEQPAPLLPLEWQAVTHYGFEGQWCRLSAALAWQAEAERLQTDFVAAVQFREMYGEQWVENDRLRTQLAKAQADLKHAMNDAERSHGDCEWLRALLKRAAGVLDTHPMKCCGLAACEHSRNRDRLLAEIEWAK